MDYGLILIKSRAFSAKAQALIGASLVDLVFACVAPSGTDMVATSAADRVC